MQVNLGTIAPNGQEVVTISYRVVITGAAAHIKNQGYVTADDLIPEPTDDPKTPEENDETVTIPPQIRIFKTDAYQDRDDDGSISAGDLIEYTFFIYNEGQVAANHVSLTDTIPAHSQLVEGSIATSQGDIISTSPRLQINLGLLMPADTVTVSFQVRVTSTVDSLANQGFISSDETIPQPSDDPETLKRYDKTITKAPSFIKDTDVLKRDRFVDADENGNLSAGDTISYIISLKNSGTGFAHQVVFSDSIPQHTSYIDGSASSSTGTIISTSPVLRIDIGTIAPNESETITLSYGVLVNTAVDKIENQGWLDSDETQPHPTDDPDTEKENDPTITSPANFKGLDDVLKADLFRDADGSGSISAGDTITYTITIKNSGAGTAFNVVFTDTIPPNTTFVAGSVRTTKGQVFSTTPILQINIGTIAPQNTELIIINYLVIVSAATDQISNQGAVQAREIDIEPTDDPDTAIENDKTITFSPSFNGETDVTKQASIIDSDDDLTISAGDVISYTIKIQNSGKAFATQVIFIDTIPAFTSFIAGSASTTKGTITKTTPILQVKIGDIAPNSSESILISFKVAVNQSIDKISNQGFVRSRETAVEPTDDPATPAINDPTIIYDSIFSTDISLRQFVHTDSFAVAVSLTDTIWYAKENETYLIFLKVANLAFIKAKNVRIIDRVPDRAAISHILPANYTLSGDSLILWEFAELNANAELSFQFEVTVPEIMPFGRNLFTNKAFASAVNEAPTALMNNSSIDTVFNDVPETPVLQPKIQASPMQVDVGDSVEIQIQIPRFTSGWDLHVKRYGGFIDTTFADDFILNSSLTTDVWHKIDQRYKPEHLISINQKEEDIIFEIIATDVRHRTGSAQTKVTVVSSNYLVLDRNVFHPEFETALGIKFKLSSTRLAKLDLYDVSGRHITNIAEDIYQGGWNLYWWSGNTETGLKVGSGVYIVTLRSDEFKAWKKFILVR